MSGQPVSGLLSGATRQLAAAGNPSPRVDAELLLMHVLGLTRAQLLTASAVSDELEADYLDLIKRRASGLPLQHLTGSAPFRHLDLAVGPGVFVPRPETELIVDLAAAALARAGLVVDLCAGSGAIALAVAQEFPAAQVLAVERSAPALTWLSGNAAARRAAGDRPIEVIRGDVADPDLLSVRTGTVDVVLSNPPYVPTGVRSQLAVEVSHDPAEAVFAGDDGLDLIPAVLAAAGRLLHSGGVVIIEHDESHAGSITGLLSGSGQWSQVQTHLDLTRRPRFTSAVRN
jgi:release factor glutamine methyltransferase